MTNIGIICPPISGHLNPMLSLGKELQKRGHRLTLFQVEDVAPKVIDEGIEFYPIGQSDYPNGSLKEYFETLSQLRGLNELKFTLQCGQKLANIICRDAPAALQKSGIELLLVDQNEPAGGTVAQYLGIPFVTICSSLPINRESFAPPVFTNWSYSKSWLAYLRNQIGYALFDRIIQPINNVLNSYRQQWKLPLIKYPDETFSQLAQISQQTADFDFPRTNLPNCFHYTGPLRNLSASVPSLENKFLSDKPIIYASLGTLFNKRPELFHIIASACEYLNVQLIISLGRGGNVKDYQQLPGSPLIYDYVPQLELLQSTALTITHAGLNTTLDCLTHGVPMVAIPISSDQPAIAARIQWTKVGEVIPLAKLTIPKLRSTVQKVLKEDSYKKNALRFKESICRAGGVVRAADIVEAVIKTGRTVPNNILSS